MAFSKEMQKALEADGEDLRQLTGEDHGPYFFDYECEDCIGMKAYGCECKYLGAIAPGGPIPPEIKATHNSPPDAKASHNHGEGDLS